MQTISTIGLDIAKSAFQVHGVDAAGQVVIRRQLKRRYVLAFFQKLPPCLIGIEACASSHHWSRELQALGHTVRLMPPAYVKPYVKRQKNDATDAEAICEAVTRANMRFVATRTPEQQSGLVPGLKFRSAAFSRLTVMCYRMAGSIGAGTNSLIAPGKKPRRKLHVRHEKTGVHHSARRRCSGLADGGAGAAGRPDATYRHTSRLRRG